MIVVSLFCCSCSTIFCGTRKNITLDANVDARDATLTVDGKVYYNVTFPYPVRVKRGFNVSHVKAEIDGYDPAYLTIEKSFNEVSVINLLSIPCWIIDIATGAMMKPDQDYYELYFRPANN